MNISSSLNPQYNKYQITPRFKGNSPLKEESKSSRIVKRTLSSMGIFAILNIGLQIVAKKSAKLRSFGLIPPKATEEITKKGFSISYLATDTAIGGALGLLLGLWENRKN